MKYYLGNTFTEVFRRENYLLGPEGCLYVGVSLCRPCGLTIFDARTVFVTDASFVFGHCLVGRDVFCVVIRACAGCWTNPVCSVAVIALSGAGFGPQLLE